MYVDYHAKRQALEYNVYHCCVWYVLNQAMMA